MLLDINVLLDVVLERDPWAQPAAELLAALETNRAQGFVAAHSLPTVYYVVAKSQDRNTATTAMHDLLRLLDVVPRAHPSPQPPRLPSFPSSERDVSAEARKDAHAALCALLPLG